MPVTALNNINIIGLYILGIHFGYTFAQPRSYRLHWLMKPTVLFYMLFCANPIQFCPSKAYLMVFAKEL
jgi:hypothetical protein